MAVIVMDFGGKFVALVFVQGFGAASEK